MTITYNCKHRRPIFDRPRTSFALKFAQMRLRQPTANKKVASKKKEIQKKNIATVSSNEDKLFLSK